MIVVRVGVKSKELFLHLTLFTSLFELLGHHLPQSGEKKCSSATDHFKLSQCWFSRKTWSILNNSSILLTCSLTYCLLWINAMFHWLDMIVRYSVNQYCISTVWQTLHVNIFLVICSRTRQSCNIITVCNLSSPHASSFRNHFRPQF